MNKFMIKKEKSMLESYAFTINSQRKMIISYRSKPLDIKYEKKTKFQV